MSLNRKGALRAMFSCAALIALAACASQAPIAPYPGGEAKVQQIENLAGQGDVKAEVQLGQMYEYGQGVPQDYGKAQGLYQKAADKGDMIGEIHLADYLLLHSENYLGAIKWDKQAMDQGSTIAAADLWYLYYYCMGVPCGQPETSEFYKRAMADRAGQEEAFDMVLQTELMRTRNTENTTNGKAIFGAATVGFDIDDSGTPRNVVIVKSSGNPDVDKAVIKGVADTRFPPVALGKDISHHYVFSLKYVP